jgi:4-amino-4-deoxy-L-arabinose transferase-like glycosyltransferase
MTRSDRRSFHLAAGTALAVGGRKAFFPLMPSSNPAPAVSSKPGRDLWLLTLLGALLYGFGLGGYPLSNPDEARYAEIPREMMANADFVTPRLDGVKYFEKPPLVYWLVAGSQWLFGPGEAAARAVPAAFAILGVLLLYGTVRRLHGREAAWWSSVVLATSLLYFAHARILLLDGVVSALIMAVLCFFALAVREPAGPVRRWLFLGLYASAALATLAKGLIGFLLPGGVMFFWLLCFNQWRRLLPMHLLGGILLFLAIAAPWHLLVASRNPEWAWFYFVHEHWLRFTTTTHGRYQPWWFFLPVVVFGFFPWTGFLWRGLRLAVAGGWRERCARADAWFPLVWAGFILLFFSVSDSKLVPYILPVFPPLAWLIGRAIADLRANDDVRSWRGPIAGSAAIVGLLGAAYILILTSPGTISAPHTVIALRPLVWPVAIALPAAALASWWLIRRNRPGVALAALGAAGGLLYYTLVLAAPTIARSSTKDLAAIVVREADTDDLVFCYHEFFHDFTYYARRTVGLVGGESELELFLDADARRSGNFVTDAEFEKLWTGSRSIFLIARPEDLPKLRAKPGFRVRVLGEEPGHLLLTNHF